MIQATERKKYHYQDPQTTMTLAEGLAEYYEANPGYNGSGDFLAQPRDTVKGHDICHVIFGLGATSEEELIVETWTFLGCQLPVKKIVAMPKTAFALELWRIFGPWRLMRRFVLTLPRVLRTVWAALHLKKRWPHFDYEAYLDKSLVDIRKEFGITLT